VSFFRHVGTEAISFWQWKEQAEAYSRTGYLEALKALSKVLEGTPRLQTYEVFRARRSTRFASPARA
jgi:hypothetical protein